MKVKIDKKELLGFITGNILGDAHIYKKNHRCFQIKHCEKQYDYLMWKKNILSKFFPDADIKVSSGISYGKYKWNGIFFVSDYFERIYEQFYNKDGVKGVTFGRLNQLTPLGLAVWYMDDGSLNLHMNRTLKNGERSVRNRSITFATNCFTYDEHVEIKKWFKVRHKIDVKINKHKSSFRTVMNATNSNKFIRIIEPYVIDSMIYKIDMKYKKIANCYSDNQKYFTTCRQDNFGLNDYM